MKIPMLFGLWVDVMVVTGNIVPVLPNLSSTVSMGVVNPVGPNPMNPVPDPVPLDPGVKLVIWFEFGPTNPVIAVIPGAIGLLEGDPFSFGKLNAE